MASKILIDRLQAIQGVLKQGHAGGAGISAASVGSERETFINLVLSNVIPPSFRVGRGDIIDAEDRSSGQVDIVIEYSGTMSFPLLRGDSDRLYLAESVCAAIEVKSHLGSQWDDVLAKAKKVAALERDVGVQGSVGVEPPKRVPFFAVGFEGWGTADIVKKKLISANKEGSVVDGVLIINSGIYLGREDSSPGANDGYSSHSFNGAESLYGFLVSIEQLTSSIIAAKPSFLRFVKP